MQINNEINKILDDVNNLTSLDISKKASDFNKDFWDLIFLIEQSFELELLEEFKIAKDKMLERFKLLDVAKSLGEVDEFGMHLRNSNVNVNKIKAFSTIKDYTFDFCKIPKEISSYKGKNPTKDIVDIISKFNSNPFGYSIYKNMMKSYQKGLENAVAIWDIKVNFALPPWEALDALASYALSLSSALSDSISSAIKQSLYEGIANFEGIPKLRDRILQSWNNPITVNVAPRVVDGNVIRAGYNYQISPEQWATTISRTETARAFTEGKLENWIESGAVEYVIYQTAADERTCEICAPWNGVVITAEKAFGLIPQHANCFIDPQVSIYTVNGWKPIGKIEVGDLVLSHKGKFRKVIQLHYNSEYYSKIVKLFFDNNFITVTEDHPVLINDKWIYAKDVKENDVIKILGHKCSGCDEIISIKKKFCSTSCSNRSSANKMWKDEDRRIDQSKKMTAQLKKEYKNGTRDKLAGLKNAHKKIKDMAKSGQLFLQKYPESISGENNPMNKYPSLKKDVSKRMKENNPMFDEKVKKKFTKYMKEHKERHPNYLLSKRGVNGMTFIEKTMNKYLIKNKVKASFNYSIDKYWVDFAILDKKIAIECDGGYWHKDKNKEKIRDQQLEKCGWTVLHFTGSQIRTDIESCIETIKRLLANHNDEYEFIDVKITKVKKWTSKRKVRLYNFSVDKDESYIAKGAVVHNCRCNLVPTLDKPPKGAVLGDKFIDAKICKAMCNQNGNKAPKFPKNIAKEKPSANKFNQIRNEAIKKFENKFVNDSKILYAAEQHIKELKKIPYYGKFKMQAKKIQSGKLNLNQVDEAMQNISNKKNIASRGVERAEQLKIKAFKSIGATEGEAQWFMDAFQSWTHSSNSVESLVLKSLSSKIQKNIITYHKGFIDTKLGKVKKLINKSMSIIKSERLRPEMLEAMFRLEQEIAKKMFKEVLGNQKTIYLYRGMDRKDFIKNGIKAKHNGVVNFSDNALSSWSTSFDDAANFGTWVARTEVNVDDLFTTWFNNPYLSDFGENEFIMAMQRPRKCTLFNIDESDLVSKIVDDDGWSQFINNK